MEKGKQIVEDKARVVQAKQKAYYDQKTWELNLLVPSRTKKFVAQWQGPYMVTRRTGKLNYEIRMPDKGGHKQVFQFNHLRKWHELTCAANAVIDVGDGIKEYRWNNGHQPWFGQHLSVNQQKEITVLDVSCN